MGQVPIRVLSVVAFHGGSYVRRGKYHTHTPECLRRTRSRAAGSRQCHTPLPSSALVQSSAPLSSSATNQWRSICEYFVPKVPFAAFVLGADPSENPAVSPSSKGTAAERSSLPSSFLRLAGARRCYNRQDSRLLRSHSALCLACSCISPCPWLLAFGSIHSTLASEATREASCPISVAERPSSTFARFGDRGCPSRKRTITGDHS